MTRLSPLSNATFFPALLAVLSHELGSPLAAIRGAATTLIDYRQQLPDEQVEEFLQSIDRQTERLNILHEDLVRLAQSAAGLLHPRAEPLDLRTVILHSLEDLPSDQRWPLCHRRSGCSGAGRLRLPAPGLRVARATPG